MFRINTDIEIPKKSHDRLCRLGPSGLDSIRQTFCSSGLYSYQTMQLYLVGEASRLLQPCYILNNPNTQHVIQFWKPYTSRKTMGITHNCIPVLIMNPKMFDMSAFEVALDITLSLSNNLTFSHITTL